MARAGASESLEQPPPEPQAKTSARAARGAAGKAKAVAEVTAEAAEAAKDVAGKVVDRVEPKPAARSKSRAAAHAPEPEPEPAPAKAKKPGGGSAKPADKAPGAGEQPKGAAPAKATKAPASGSSKTRAKGAKARATGIEASAAASGLPAKTLEKLSRLLEEERETYLRQARDLAAEAEALASEREPGDTQFDEESGEGDTLNIERERDLALSASARQAVEEIDRALNRMAAGTYGMCERCGKKISVARLEALPYAALCIECKSREERRR